MKKKSAKVLILYTGGTFGMDPPGSRGMANPDLGPEALRRRLHDRVPELKELAQCDVDVLLNRDSAHVGPAEWCEFASAIRSKWKNYDGIVLLHGTDTMAYTASALSFLLRPCRVPVVITGAQRPLSAIRTDARRNLISAVEIAARGPRSCVARVLVFFDNQLFQGNRVRKRSASEFAAFESPMAPPLAVVGTEICYSEPKPGPSSKQRVSEKLVAKFNSRVLLLHVTPGFPAREVRERLLPGLDGLVLVVFQSGTAPTHDPEFIELLRGARKQGVPAVIVTEGRSQGNPMTYAAGRPLLKEGGYWAGAMTPECAMVKTAWILGQPNGARRFKSLWKIEFSEEGSRTQG